MKVIYCVIILNFSLGLYSQNMDYTQYHQKMLSIEESIAAEKYMQAMVQINQLTTAYDFIFLKDIKIATQLAVHLNDYEKAFQFLEQGMAAGWGLKRIKKERFLKPLMKNNSWTNLVEKYPKIHRSYQNKLNLELREVTKVMIKKDQKMAWKYLLKIGQKAKERYANKKIKPHALQQMKKLDSILEAVGYPGEKLIGESVWMSTILSHHNSVSDNFVKNDTLFEAIRPRLLNAIIKGELNPYDFAMIEDWRIAITSDRQKTGYGYLEHIKPKQIVASDALREKLGIRPIELRNKLVNIQEKTGMKFYLGGAGWVNGKIGTTD